MELLPGSILSRSLPGFLGLFYVHMGIYLGNDTVIHYKGERKSRRNALLNKDSLHAFAEDYEVTVHAPPKNRAKTLPICCRVGVPCRRLSTHRVAGYAPSPPLRGAHCVKLDEHDLALVVALPYNEDRLGSVFHTSEDEA